ncbi:hypothetical protein NQD34_016742 [Periophthalmus magnuspinnatus]|nr:hypothetical protein NQD34_016742 [Periophthalmus magnuspinnatus]
MDMTNLLSAMLQIGSEHGCTSGSTVPGSNSLYIEKLPSVGHRAYCFRNSSLQSVFNSISACNFVCPFDSILRQREALMLPIHTSDIEPCPSTHACMSHLYYC